MFWAATIYDELVGPFRVKDAVKMTAPTVHSVPEGALVVML